MAENITPEQVQSLPALPTVLGFDANNKWAKTPGTTFAVKADLDKLAPLASPEFTGIPKAPSAVTGTNNTQIANTAFVQATVNSVRNTATQAAADAAAAKTTAEAAAVTANDAAAKADDAQQYILKAPLAVTTTSVTANLTWKLNGQILLCAGNLTQTVNLVLDPTADIPTSSYTAITGKLILRSSIATLTINLNYRGAVKTLTLTGLTPGARYTVDIVYYTDGTTPFYTASVNPISLA